MDLKEKLEAYRDGGTYPLHMPGHKRNTQRYAMDNPYGLDITEIHGFDDLHAPEGVLLEGMERAARIWGSRRAWYLVNGSTAGILAGICALAGPGDKVLAARNCHRSVYNAIVLSRAEPVWIMPEVEEEWGLSGSIMPDVVEKMLEKDDISAVVVTSPTYEGVLSDVASIARICHGKGVPLLVDEAHGAHLGFGAFPAGAVAAGADLVVQSLHKTLPAFTQTGLLHLQGDLADPARVKHFLDIFQSSSPSYILMAGIDRCLHLLEEKTGFTEEWMEALRDFYRETASLKRLRVFGNPFAGPVSGKSVYQRDPSKLVIGTTGAGLGGPGLAELLRTRYRFEVEMAAAGYVIAMTGAGDRREELLRFAAALQETDACAEGREARIPAGETAALCRPETVLPLWQADASAGVRVPFSEDLIGKISLEFVYAYPPGIPLLAPGERVTGEVWRLLEKLRSSGVLLRGMEEPSTLRTWADPSAQPAGRHPKKP